MTDGILIETISKSFDKVQSLASVSAEIAFGSVYGLIGTNGAGKSTLLRILAGIYRQDAGTVLYSGREVWENTEVKGEIFYLPDDPFFFANGTVGETARYYKSLYRRWSEETYRKLVKEFGLNTERKVSTFSRGMQKQAAILLALSCRPRYLLCDETFDGLDPAMRQFVKRLFMEEVADGNLTPVIASHNLREIEDICDRAGLLHRGEMLFSRGLDDMRDGVRKVQLVLPEGKDETVLRAGKFASLRVSDVRRSGSMVSFLAHGTEEAITAAVAEVLPVWSQLLPLSLEEIFICETEEKGYDFTECLG